MSSTKQNVAEEAALERIQRRPADARVNTSVEKRPHVVVLGAGPAGLGATNQIPAEDFAFALEACGVGRRHGARAAASIFSSDCNCGLRSLHRALGRAVPSKRNVASWPTVMGSSE